MANINRIEHGRMWNENEKRFVFGNYPFHKLASSHVCRRTFATMYYGKMPTPYIMSVTGHKTEKEFLGYIGVDNSTLSANFYEYWERMEQKETTLEQGHTKTAN